VNSLTATATATSRLSKPKMAPSAVLRLAWKRRLPQQAWTHDELRVLPEHLGALQIRDKLVQLVFSRRTGRVAHLKAGIPTEIPRTGGHEHTGWKHTGGDIAGPGPAAKRRHCRTA